ncbi:hypothetical protein [Paenibacillus harenae]|uniref:hypothetical protein n=1 Tax=Paenibacillus harenae TaxID=306543 RepID=UPI00278E6C4D|nr:hypothetical protein [Paenibacillus harenae]MDQ0059464.1 hypothetical protein [Paenibacillus harenae]
MVVGRIDDCNGVIVLPLLNTCNPDALYDSLAHIFSAPRHMIEYAVIRNTLELQRLSSAEEVDLKSIKKTIEDKTGTEINIGDFDYVAVSHPRAVNPG